MNVDALKAAALHLLPRPSALGKRCKRTQEDQKNIQALLGGTDFGCQQQIVSELEVCSVTPSPRVLTIVVITIHACSK